MREEQAARRRLTRLLDALPVFTGFCSPDGHLLQTRPPTRENFLWALPAFAYSHDSITQIVDLCEEAARGQTVQVERPYRRDFANPPETAPVPVEAQPMAPAGSLEPTATDRLGDIPSTEDLCRGLLTLTPIFDEDGFVSELGVSLIDCEENGLMERDERTKSRLALTNRRIDSALSLAQMVIEAVVEDGAVGSRSRPDETTARERIARRLNTLSRTIDWMADPDSRSVDLRQVLGAAFADIDEDLVEERLTLTRTPGVTQLDVPTDVAPILVLLLSELADNAVRYGAWRQGYPRGRVTVDGQVMDSARGRWLRINWMEDGGPEVAAAPLRGFGAALGERLFPQMTGGEADWLLDADGVSWTLGLPLQSALREPGGDGGYAGGFGDDDADAGLDYGGGFDGGYDGFDPDDGGGGSAA